VLVRVARQFVGLTGTLLSRYADDLFNTNVDALTAAVTRMARVGRCGGATFSPDSKTLAVICDMSGVPQVWTVGVDGGWPNLVTTLNDPVTAVEWSPTNSDVMAIQIAPGGGMNTQIYTVNPDGTGLKLYTAGGKDNNWLGRWTHDGSALSMSTNVKGTNTDSYLLDVFAGEMKLVAENPGAGNIDEVSRDGRYALVNRLKSRGSNDACLVNLTNKKETLLTPHEGPGELTGAPCTWHRTRTATCLHSARSR
jgi:Tol biopolymer transport system component